MSESLTFKASKRTYIHTHKHISQSIYVSQLLFIKWKSSAFAAPSLEFYYLLAFLVACHQTDNLSKNVYKHIRTYVCTCLYVCKYFIYKWFNYSTDHFMFCLGSVSLQSTLSHTKCCTTYLVATYRKAHTSAHISTCSNPTHTCLWDFYREIAKCARWRCRVIEGVCCLFKNKSKILQLKCARKAEYFCKCCQSGYVYLNAVVICLRCQLFVFYLFFFLLFPTGQTRSDFMSIALSKLFVYILYSHIYFE